MVGWLGRITKVYEEIWRKNRYSHYLACGDVFMAVYVQTYQMVCF